MNQFENLGFKPAYLCNAWPELPGDGSGEILPFPHNMGRKTGSGLLVFVEPDGSKEWMGAFVRGMGRYTKFCACPNPNQLCVVSEGSIYIVDVRDPANYFMPNIDPVCDVVALPDMGKLLFNDYSNLCAVGEQGIEWISENLATDGLKIEWTDDKLCHMSGWSAPENEVLQVDVDLKNGRIVNPERS